MAIRIKLQIFRGYIQEAVFAASFKQIQEIGFQAARAVRVVKKKILTLMVYSSGLFTNQ